MRIIGDLYLVSAPHTFAEHLEGIYNKREIPCATMHIPSPHPMPNHNTHVAATNNPNGQEQCRDFQIAELQELGQGRKDN